MKKQAPKSKGMIIPKIIEHKNWIHGGGVYDQSRQKAHVFRHGMNVVTFTPQAK
jgi:hypothetical protein